MIDLTADLKDEEKQARFAMLEKLADYDEHLMEELLSDQSRRATRCSTIWRKSWPTVSWCPR